MCRIVIRSKREHHERRVPLDDSVDQLVSEHLPEFVNLNVNCNM